MPVNSPRGIRRCQCHSTDLDMTSQASLYRGLRPVAVIASIAVVGITGPGCSDVPFAPLVLLALATGGCRPLRETRVAVVMFDILFVLIRHRVESSCLSFSGLGMLLTQHTRYTHSGDAFHQLAAHSGVPGRNVCADFRASTDHEP